MPDLASFAPHELALYHRNPNLGNVAAVKASLRAHGQFRPVVVNLGTHTGRPYEVLAGNHTLKAFRELAEEDAADKRWHRIDGYVLDVDGDEAARIVLADNKTAQDGQGYDNAILTDLLGSLPDLVGTGFSDDEYSDLLAGLEEAMPSLPDDGLIDQRDQGDKADTYADVATRVVVLQFGMDRYVWVQQQLEAYRAAMGLLSNSEALATLLSDWSGDPAPDNESDTQPEGGRGIPGGGGDVHQAKGKTRVNRDAPPAQLL